MAEQGPVQHSLEISVLENQLQVPNIEEVCSYLEKPGVCLELLDVGRHDELPLPFDRIKIKAENHRDRLSLSTVTLLDYEEFPSFGEEKFKYFVIGGRSDAEKTSPVNEGFERKVRPTEASGFAVYKAPISGLKAAISLFKSQKVKSHITKMGVEITNQKKFPEHYRGRPVGYSIKPRHTKGIETAEYVEDFLKISMLALCALTKYSGHNENLSLRTSAVIPKVRTQNAIKTTEQSRSLILRRETENASTPAIDEQPIAAKQNEAPAKRQVTIPDEELMNGSNAKEDIVRLSDIGGLEDAKKQIRKITLSYKHQDIAELWGSPVARTIMFYGPPGTGKTTLARAMAHEIGADFQNISSSEINDKFVGNTGKNMDQFFDDLCELEKPTVVLFDEFDTIVQPKNNGSNEKAEAAGIFKRRMNTLTDDNPNVILIATTNNDQDITADYMDRFQKKIYVPHPDEKAREQIWRIKISPLLEKGTDAFRPFGNMELSELHDIIQELAQKTEGLTGRHIENIFNRIKEDKAEEHMLRGGFTPICREDFLVALDSFRTQ